jgi:hypothetical protein
VLDRVRALDTEICEEALRRAASGGAPHAYGRARATIRQSNLILADATESAAAE